jgi:aspartyl-tRNA(Asn)/glutamyl-tRNA(Gln) amidotransferase subunit A
MQPYEMTIHQAAKSLKAREISARELAQSVITRIERVDESIGAYLTVDPEYTLKLAETADEKIGKGEGTPLTGIPLSIKDLISTEGLKTTCASRILEAYVPIYDACVIEKLKQEGAVIAGKVNMDEFAMGSSTENSAFKVTRNPWDLTCIPGGSSGGSAASVAADMCLGSLGSDTGGSIRQPASHCGVVGLKPTYGRVSRYGLVAFASSLDQIGPLTKTVSDAALLMNGISGFDLRDSTASKKERPDFTSFLSKGLGDMTIGIPKEYLETEGIDPDVRAAVMNAISVMKGLGATITDVSLPHSRYAVAAYYVIAPSEASSNLARYDGVKYGFRNDTPASLIDMYRETRSKGFGPEVQRRIIIGTYALSAGYYDAYYGKASKVRTLIMDDFERSFRSCDVILSPVSPIPAFPIGEKIDDPLTMYLLDIFTLSANLAGIPGISVPCGFSRKGLPIGLQLMSRHFEEGKLLKAAYSFEQETDFHLKKPHLPGDES